jgi:hypothetical protein
MSGNPSIFVQGENAAQFTCPNGLNGGLVMHPMFDNTAAYRVVCSDASAKDTATSISPTSGGTPATAADGVKFAGITVGDHRGPVSKKLDLQPGVYVQCKEWKGTIPPTLNTTRVQDGSRTGASGYNVFCTQ